jgi:hypothetical protein
VPHRNGCWLLAAGFWRYPEQGKISLGIKRMRRIAPINLINWSRSVHPSYSRRVLLLVFASSEQPKARKASSAILKPEIGQIEPISPPKRVGEWLSLVEHLVRDQGVGGSNPLSPTISS